MHNHICATNKNPKTSTLRIKTFALRTRNLETRALISVEAKVFATVWGRGGLSATMTTTTATVNHNEDDDDLVTQTGHLLCFFPRSLKQFSLTCQLSSHSFLPCFSFASSPICFAHLTFCYSHSTGNLRHSCQVALTSGNAFAISMFSLYE